MATDNLTNNQLLLKECINQDFADSNSYPNISDYFEFFAASQVLKNYNMSDDELDNGLTGGGLDGGCDGIYIFLNGDLISADQIENLSAPKGSSLTMSIVQAKNTFSFKEDAIMKWKTVSENLLSMSNPLDSFKQRYSEATIEGFGMYRDIITRLIRCQLKCTIQYYYVTLAAEVHPNVKQQANELIDLVKRIYPATNVDVSFVGADKLMELYNTDSEISINLELAEQPIALGKKVDYVALINLSTYFKFITDENGVLRKSFFEANVRDYQGHNSVNSSIAESLENISEEDFWWLNNGITLLASNVTPVRTRELLLVNPEIVNGLQTSNEIYNYFDSHKELLETESRNVLVRIIVPESEEARDNIIFATNNQTNIPKSSLRVTDTIHLQIEMYFKSRGLYYDRRKNYYKNQKKKASEIIGVSFLAQCLISIILRKPDYARARPSTLLTDDQTYKLLYEDNKELKAYYNVAIIGKMVQQHLKSNADMTPAERSDILFYLLYAIVAKKLNKTNISFSDMVNFDSSQVSYQEIEDMRVSVYSKYKLLGGNGRVAKSATFINEIDSILGL